ncbi:MAG: 1-acyl-sn-glycerol-3-phosphate acyltransferase [Clostridia bacterium]|nr:1-acyl-sn-glycerol-3-phosphate acyltransferase [Clostridia bacterium]
MKKVNKFYRFLQILLFPFYKLFFRMEVIGRENELMEGPCLICANHLSNHDILFLALNLKRQIYFFAKRELFKFKPFGALLKWFGTISVHRGQVDLKAITQTIAVLKDGGYVGIYPQGTRTHREPRPEDAKSGVGLMAYRAKSNVLPIYIKTKNHRVRLFRKVTVIIGKPIPYEELGFTKGGMAEYTAAATQIFTRICELGKEHE